MKRSDDDSDVSRETPDWETHPFVGRVTDYERLAEDLGFRLDGWQIELLCRYGSWLIEEALPSGGIGPDEAPRLFDRHVADSLAYVPHLPSRSTHIVDVGSGVGLPGIPIAIARPDDEITLLDRSERRTWLARRAVRILDLRNVDVVTGDARAFGQRRDVAVFRASLRIDAAARVLEEIVGAHGLGLIGVSRLAEEPTVPQPPDDVTFDLRRTTSRVLDSPFWLLRMQTNSLDSRENTAP